MKAAKAIPPECELHSILGKEEERCHDALSKEEENGSEAAWEELGCAGMWDNVSCWPSSSVGQTVVIPCPEFLYILTGKEGFVYRNCTDTGWSESFPRHDIACGYDVNDTTHDDRRLYFMSLKTMYTVGYSTSLTSLSVAMAILFYFRKLQCTRNYIHMHLFTSFILRAISIFVKDMVLFSSEDIYHCNAYSAKCKFVMVFFQYCIMANYSWLLVEGLYLHTLLVITFFSERKYFWWYIVLGWGLPLVFMMSWSIARHLYENIGCWDINTNSGIWWIIRGPVILSIFINFILFVSIIRILITKLRTPDVRGNDINQYKRLAKSTLLLIPLFGVHYIVFAFFPEDVSDVTLEIRLFLELSLGSFQGFVVAVLYCFLNGEVQYEIKRKWRRRQLRKHFDSRQHQNSMTSNGGPGTTTTQVSLLTKCSPQDQRKFSTQSSSVV
nr:PREDICTED: secretin receptor [Latimeria chalumnae]|eukprot:XP_014341076.1 PREDICTED: secretin receptor [Latimeria chalumnae]